MELTRERIQALGVALNEATLVGVEIDEQQRGVGVTFSVLTLPQTGPAPQDTRVQFVLFPVGRVIASLRNGDWNDVDAEILQVAPEELLTVVQSFGGQPVYGWNFFDVRDDAKEHWIDQLSLDWGAREDGMEHTLTLFQEGVERHLDLRIWFDAFVICDPYGNQIEVEEFCAGGQRWWRAFNEGDPRTRGAGLSTLDDEESP